MLNWIFSFCLFSSLVTQIYVNGCISFSVIRRKDDYINKNTVIEPFPIKKSNPWKRTKKYFPRSQLRNAENCGVLGGDSENGRNLTKIVNGAVVSENEIPWQLSLLKSDGSWDGCGAILLSCQPLIVITAAHCVETKSPEDLLVGFGDHHLLGISSPIDTNEVRLRVKQIIVHPEFRLLSVNPGRHARWFFSAFSILNLAENDIAVLKLESAEILQCRQKMIWPACLPVRGHNYDTETSGHFGLVSGQVCAGGIGEDITGVCQGDSGGPLAGVDSDGRWTIVGLVSWRLAIGGACNGRTYSVFTKISHYLPWIQSLF